MMAKCVLCGSDFDDECEECDYMALNDYATSVEQELHELRQKIQDGEMNNGRMYHYLTSGLKNVYLVNGYKKFETPEGNAVSIQNIDSLHRAIAENLISLRRRLHGDEFRFLRIEMDMSQKALGLLLDKKGQTVAKWEKGEVPVPKLADIITRKLYSESVGQNSGLRGFFDTLNKLDRNRQEESMQFKKEENEWHTAA